MYCKNCGTNINQGESFCRTCGTKIDWYQAQPNNVQQSNYQANQVYTSPNNPYAQQNQMYGQTNNQQYQQNNGMYIQPNTPTQQHDNVNKQYDNSIDNENLVRIYIGKNADKIMEGNFSISAFIFGMWYFLYRKMWLLAILLIIGNVIANLFLPSLASILTIVADIFIAFKFNKMYLKQAEDKVQKIKYKNPGATPEELIRLCKKKGGTAIWPIIIYFLLTIIAIIIISVVTVYYAEVVSNAHDSTSYGIANLKVTIPNTYERVSSYPDSYLYYRYEDENNNCDITINTISASLYSTEESYIKGNIKYLESSQASQIETTYLNGTKWHYIEIENLYSLKQYYVVKDNEYIYRVAFTVYKNDGICYDSYKSIIKSLKLGN